MQNQLINKIVGRINASKSFLITAHINVEGDALGSELAMYLLLKKLKKKVVIYNNDVTPAIYNFFPSVKVIKNSIGDSLFDTALFLDCSDASRAGKVKDVLGKANCIINIDHHISNTYFGDINWVDPCAGSTAQMIYKLCERFKIIDKRIALCLYTGIFTDTGNFTYASTNQEVHQIVAHLMKYDLRPNKIYNDLHSLCAPEDLKFIGKIISSLKFDATRRICWAVIDKWSDHHYDLTEVLFSVMRLSKYSEVFLLFKGIGKNSTRVNFRSRSKVNVDRVAKFFGGGGHKKASGTTVESPLEETENKVISFIKKHTNCLKIKQSK